MNPIHFFKVISIDQAKHTIEKVFSNLKLGTFKSHILNATGLVLAQDIVSCIDVPEFNRSIVDGYAICSQDSYGSTEAVPSTLSLIGKVEMGKGSNLSVKSGEAVYVPTGGMIPQGTDSVVMIEYAESLDDMTIMINRPVTKGENIIFTGDDIKKGEKLFPKGHKLYSQDIGALAAIGVQDVLVFEKVKVYIISTGNEIIDLDQSLTMGAVRDINGYALHAMVNEIGGEVVGKVIVRDDFDFIKSETQKGIDSSHIVLISGGSSVGTKDYTYDVINSFDGKGVFIHGLAIKPGKPTIVGEANGKVIFGLPGHPVSSIIVFKVLVQSFINKLTGTKQKVKKTKAIMTSNLHSSPGKTTFQMVNIIEKQDELYAVPIFAKSGMISLLTRADGYIIIKSSEEGVYKGKEQDVYFFS